MMATAGLQRHRASAVTPQESLESLVSTVDHYRKLWMTCLDAEAGLDGGRAADEGTEGRASGKRSRKSISLAAALKAAGTSSSPASGVKVNVSEAKRQLADEATQIRTNIISKIRSTYDILLKECPTDIDELATGSLVSTLLSQYGVIRRFSELRLGLAQTLRSFSHLADSVRKLEAHRLSSVTGQTSLPVVTNQNLTRSQVQKVLRTNFDRVLATTRKHVTECLTLLREICAAMEWSETQFLTARHPHGTFIDIVKELMHGLQLVTDCVGVKHYLTAAELRNPLLVDIDGVLRLFPDPAEEFKGTAVRRMDPSVAGSKDDDIRSLACSQISKSGLGQGGSLQLPPSVDHQSSSENRVQNRVVRRERAPSISSGHESDALSLERSRAGGDTPTSSAAYLANLSSTSALVRACHAWVRLAKSFAPVDPAPIPSGLPSLSGSQQTLLSRQAPTVSNDLQHKEELMPSQCRRDPFAALHTTSAAPKLRQDPVTRNDGQSPTSSASPHSDRGSATSPKSTHLRSFFGSASIGNWGREFQLDRSPMSNLPNDSNLIPLQGTPSASIRNNVEPGSGLVGGRSGFLSGGDQMNSQSLSRRSSKSGSISLAGKNVQSAAPQEDSDTLSRLQDLRRRSASRVLARFAAITALKRHEKHLAELQAQELTMAENFVNLAAQIERAKREEKSEEERAVLDPLQQKAGARLLNWLRGILRTKKARYLVKLLKQRRRQVRAIGLIRYWWREVLPQRNAFRVERIVKQRLKRFFRANLKHDVAVADAAPLSWQRLGRSYVARLKLQRTQRSINEAQRFTLLRNACWCLLAKRDLRRRLELRSKRQNKLFVLDVERRAAIHIQRVFRGHCARLVAKELAHSRKLDVDWARRKALVILRRAINRFMAVLERRKRHRIAEEQKEAERLAQLQAAAVTRLQRWWWRIRTRRNIESERKARAELEHRVLGTAHKTLLFRVRVRRDLATLTDAYIDRMCSAALDDGFGDPSLSPGGGRSRLSERERRKRLHLSAADVPAIMPPMVVQSAMATDVSFSLFSHTTGLFALHTVNDYAKDLSTLAIQALLKAPPLLLYLLCGLCLKPRDTLIALKVEEQEKKDSADGKEQSSESPNSSPVAEDPNLSEHLDGNGSDGEGEEEEEDEEDDEDVADRSNESEVDDSQRHSSNSGRPPRPSTSLGSPILGKGAIEDDEDDEDGSAEKEGVQEPVTASKKTPQQSTTRLVPRAPFMLWRNANDLFNRAFSYGVEWACNAMFPALNGLPPSSPYYLYEDVDEQINAENFMLTVFGVHHVDEWVSIVHKDIGVFSRIGDTAARQTLADTGTVLEEIEEEEMRETMRKRDHLVESSRFVENIARTCWRVNSLYEADNRVYEQGVELMLSRAASKSLMAQRMFAGWVKAELASSVTVPAHETPLDSEETTSIYINQIKAILLKGFPVPAAVQSSASDSASRSQLGSSQEDNESSIEDDSEGGPPSVMSSPTEGALSA